MSTVSGTVGSLHGRCSMFGKAGVGKREVKVDLLFLVKSQNKSRMMGGTDVSGSEVEPVG
jgi:hypothetical protein